MLGVQVVPLVRAGAPLLLLSLVFNAACPVFRAPGAKADICLETRDLAVCRERTPAGENKDAISPSVILGHSDLSTGLHTRV